MSGTLPSNVPIPDPSVITTQDIDKAKVELREDYSTRIEALNSIIITRLDGMDKASTILSENVNRVPTLLDREIARLQALFEQKAEGLELLFVEKFASIQVQFRERDIRTDQAAIAATTAINAALSALKEMIGLQNQANATSINKSETNTVKQIDSILALLATSAKSTDEKIQANAKSIDQQISTINSRLDRGDGGHSNQASNQTTMIAIAAIVVSVVVGGFAIINGLRGNAEQTQHEVIYQLAPAPAPAPAPQYLYQAPPVGTAAPPAIIQVPQPK